MALHCPYPTPLRLTCERSSVLPALYLIQIKIKLLSVVSVEIDQITTDQRLTWA